MSNNAVRGFSQSWLAYLSVGITATGGYFLLPSAGAQNIFSDFVGFSAVAAVVVGVRLHRPTRHFGRILGEEILLHPGHLSRV